MTADLDIILPMYNPLPGWEDTVKKSCNKLHSLSPELNFRLIVVNDGSTRKSVSTEQKVLSREFNKHLFLSYEQNKGKGYAVRKGAEAATAPIIIFTDVDFPYMEEDLLAVFRILETGKADLVLSQREPDYYRKAPWMREMISRFLKFFVRLLFRIPTADTQGGLKGFSRRGLELLKATQTNGYLFDLELVKRAARQTDFKIEKVPSRLKPEVQFSTVRASLLFRESLNLIRIFFLRS